MFRIGTLESLLALTDLKTVTDVVAMRALGAAIENVDGDWTGQSSPSFKARYERAFAAAAGCDLPSAERVMAIMLGCSDYETGQSLHGIGGSVAKPLDEVLAETLGHPFSAPSPGR